MTNPTVPPDGFSSGKTPRESSWGEGLEDLPEPPKELKDLKELPATLGSITCKKVECRTGQTSSAHSGSDVSAEIIGTVAPGKSLELEFVEGGKLTTAAVTKIVAMENGAYWVFVRGADADRHPWAYEIRPDFVRTGRKEFAHRIETVTGSTTQQAA
ncbi:hypothetical protein COU80_05620 [Candidatus Peregrinibacteria bacterium CG10_big_fil_rev_8_21_14_0_10_55_24]|nr:MAG: hypothetical protein COU80_05620 [Candidatus Peregrinibacteria bacterium CG10_big_fil_rev_8_21_14_0_10_55_24]